MKPTDKIEAVRGKMLELMAERDALGAELGYNEASIPTDERWLALQAKINPLADAVEKHDKNEELRALQAQEKALLKWLTPTQRVLVDVRREQINARSTPGGTAIRECEQRAAEYDDDRFNYGLAQPIGGLTATASVKARNA